MAHRQFIDSSGNEWLVFDVTPRVLEERRTHDRRGVDGSGESQDRREDDRRVTVGSPHPPRLTKGWLCFERNGERRRLQPVPDQWMSLPDAELQKFLSAARVAPTRHTASESAPAGRR